MKSKFNFKTWVKTMGMVALVMIVLDTLRVPDFLIGWFCCMTFDHARAYFTNTKLKYVPKSGIADDMD